MKIYVPNNQDYSCFVVQSDSIIRAYKTIPTQNSSVDYRDYYYTSNYLYRDGTQTFSNYSNLPVCLPNEELTTSVYYRNDFDSILVITFILLIICFYFPYRIISRMFGRWLKL